MIDTTQRQTKALFRAIAILCVALSGVGGAPPAEIRITTVGETFSASKISYAGKGDLAVTKSDGTTVAVPVADIIELHMGSASAATPPEGAVGIELNNGDLLIGKIVAGDAGMATIETASLGKCAVPFDVVRSVLFGGKLRDRKREEVDTSKGDVLTFVNGDIDVGRIQSVGPNGVLFKSEQLGETTISLDKLASIALEALEEKAKPPATALVGEVALTDGTRITSTISSISADGTITLASTLLPAVKGAAKREAVVDIFFRNAKLVYLSDLTPAGTNERPYIEGDGALTFSYRKDRCVCSPAKPIAIDGKTYRKGLGVHAYSLLQYKLDKQFTRFNVVAGLDDTTNGQGSVEFKVYGDKKKLYESGVVAGKAIVGKIAGATQGPKAIALDVTGVDELMLVVDFGPDHDILDRAAWANAFLIRK